MVSTSWGIHESLRPPAHCRALFIVCNSWMSRVLGGSSGKNHKLLVLLFMLDQILFLHPLSESPSLQGRVDNRVVSKGKGGYTGGQPSLASFGEGF